MAQPPCRHVCGCTHTHTHAHTRTHVHTHTHTHTHTHKTHTCTYTHTHAHNTRTHKLTYTHTTHVRTHTHSHTRTRTTHVHTYTHTHTHAHAHACSRTCAHSHTVPLLTSQKAALYPSNLAQIDPSYFRSLLKNRRKRVKLGPRLVCVLEANPGAGPARAKPPRNPLHLLRYSPHECLVRWFGLLTQCLLPDPLLEPQSLLLMFWDGVVELFQGLAL